MWEVPPSLGKGGKGGKGGRGGRDGRRGNGLARYVVAAALARTADGGAVVAVVLLVTSFGGSGTLAGVLGAFFFASTLVARTEYAPSGARGQVFIWVAALKITSGSAGTALAGSLTGVTVQLPLVVGLLAVSAAVVAATVETRFAGVGEKRRP
ncbi:hypothetical protein [Streptomyces sp. NPDC101455]|uniref:hypothetical protein n=1 Tax=Streptomyces sp. NPDC101455 TaxID=3366142 RepID=UPI003805FFFE